MNAVPYSLLSIIRLHDPGQLALTVLRTGEQVTFGELSASASAYRRGLAQLGSKAGDTVACALPPGPGLWSLVLACWESGLRLQFLSARDRRKLGAAGRSAPQVAVWETEAWRDEHASSGVRSVSIDQLRQAAALWTLPDPEQRATEASLSASAEDGVETVGVELLLRSVDNFRASHPVSAGAVLVSGSTPLSLEGAFVSVVLPLALGLHSVAVPGMAQAAPESLAAALMAADLCELPGPDWSALARADASRRLPGRVQTLLLGSEPLAGWEIGPVENTLGRAVWRGLGAGETGFWAGSSSGSARRSGRFDVKVRPLRSPLQLAGADAGEIVLSPVQAEASRATPGHDRNGAPGAGEGRTGLVGWVGEGGEVVVAGRLADVVVRGGRAFLLSELDRMIAGIAGVRTSRTFREQGLSPTEKAMCVCLVEPGTSLPTPLVEATGGLPDRVVTLEADPCRELPDIATLRAAVTGEAGRAVIAATTARRFRRNPAHDEAGLAAAVERALLGDGSLEFLMFWGCGPRRHAAGPDRAAVDALADLLAAAEAAAPVRARAHVICTDVHATNNGHSEVHYRSYFDEVSRLARGLDVQFEFESAVWHRGGLTRAGIEALEREAGFLARWDRFALRDRFVQQAGRHSRLANKTLAARHYYATCLLEREVLRSLYPSSIFLTYNGPDFNECFPDLPTLYVYPGPRGRNDKPWFVDVDEPAQVAAE